MRYTAPQKYRAETYAELKRILIDFTGPPYGSGTDGVVFKSSRQTAVKVFERSDQFQLEKQCYDRLKRRKMTTVAGFNVPEIVDSDSALAVIEMTVVRPPYVLDFGKVTIDRRPDFSPEVWAESRAQWADLYEDHWPSVRKVLNALSAIGIHYLDPKPGNIMPDNWNPTL